MARNTTFGITPWGQAWLRSLDKIDWQNRLPRGASYARIGRVTSISVDQNRIEAFVQGRQPQPYRIGIVALPLQKRNVTKLVKLIASRPDLLSRILNRELPLEIEHLSAEADILLFPRSWKDLKLTCSCPDWAVPCKHLAAVLYLVANEIDKNPFMVFSLLGVDLMEALSKLGYSTSGLSEQIEVKRLSSFFIKPKRGRKKSVHREMPVPDIDLSKIPDVGTDLIEYLPEPVFSSHLRPTLIKLYRGYSHQAKQQIDKDVADFPSWLESIRNVEIQLNAQGGLLNAHFIGWEHYRSSNITRRDTMVELMQSLMSAHADHLCSDLQYCALVHIAALQLLRKGTFIPEILQCPDGTYLNRWIPAIQVPAVNDLVKNLSVGIPEHLLKWSVHGEVFMTSNFDACISLLSFFLGHYINLWIVRSVEYDFLSRFLTSGTPHPFRAFSEREIPGAFQQWLSNLQLSLDGFKPIITVTELSGTHFGVSLDIEITTTHDTDILSFTAFRATRKYASQHLSVMRTVSLIGNKLPVVNAFLKHPDEDLILTGEEIIPFLHAVNPVMRLTQMRVTLPKSLQHLLRPQTTGHFTTKQKSSGLFSLLSLLSFDWRIAVGDQVISIAEFRKLISSNSRLVRYRDQYIILEEKDVQSILRRIEKPNNLSGPEMLRSVILGHYDGARVSLSADVQRELKNLKASTEVTLPGNLNASLRPYQLRGYGWMYKNARLGLGSILADDMGLGKTLQVLTLLLKFKEEGVFNKQKALVVAPATLLTNWQRESEKFTPDLKTHIYHGSSRAIPPRNCDVLLTTYGLVRQDQDYFQKTKWAMIVIDEAQAIKNPEAAQTRTVHTLKAPIRIAMSGTPVENRLLEYFSIFHFTNPGYLGTAHHFKTTYAHPIEKNRDQHCLDQFRRMTEPFIMRRMKTDKTIISDLPDKTEMNRYCTLTKTQAALYTSITQEIMKQIEQSEGIERRGLVLALLLKLKQVCNHPYNRLKTGSRDISLTGKGDCLLEVVNAIKEEGSKMLIFTQFKEMGDLLINMLSSIGEHAFFLHGGLSRKQRDDIVSTFQEQPYPRILILSIKAGGTGLNLTAATHVIHYDLWWNPAVERQATDRAFRIGQKHKVTVHRIITQHTLEEKIDALIQSKKELADLTVVSGEKWIGELSDRELKKLVELEG